MTIHPLRSSAPLSKSRYVHGMQCPLYVWLEVRTDEPKAEADAFTQALFGSGHQVGALAQRRWDERLRAAGKALGLLVDDDPLHHAAATAQTQEALAGGASVIYEAAFTHGGVKVRVDVLERLPDGTFGVFEVKQTTAYDKKKHLRDAAVQRWVVGGAGLEVSRVCLVHLNGSYEWPGGDYDLEALFAETDITAEVAAVQDETGINVARVLRIVECDDPPTVPQGTPCTTPYACPYLAGCPALGEPIEHPVSELRGNTKALVKRAAAVGVVSLLEIDAASAGQILTTAGGDLNDHWYATWKATATGERIVLPSFRDTLARLDYPLYHLDFEAIAAPLPLVVHTHPFEAVPLQYSVHVEQADGGLEHREFLAAWDDPDPRRSLIDAMLVDLGASGSIIHWADYEKTIIRRLMENPLYSEYHGRLHALTDRLVDLGRAVDVGVFQREFHGKWSLKVVYPALVPDGAAADVHEGTGVFYYEDLEGPARGDEAALWLAEYLMASTTAGRRDEIRRQLLRYCNLDTLATVRVLRALRGL